MVELKPLHKWTFVCLLVIAVIVTGLYFTHQELLASSSESQQSYQSLPAEDDVKQIKSNVSALVQAPAESPQEVLSPTTGVEPAGTVERQTLPAVDRGTIIAPVIIPNIPASDQSPPSVSAQESTKIGPVASLTPESPARETTNGASSAQTTAGPAGEQVTTAAEKIDIEAWEKFKLTYNKSYQSREKELERRDIFFINSLFISEFNQKSGALYTLGVNQFADLTRDEINHLFIGPQMRWLDIISRLPTPIPTHSIAQTASIDWRNTMREPFDQGNCLQSAVHTAISLLEGKSRSGDTENRLSPTQLLDCMATRERPPCSGLVTLDEVFSFLTRSKLPEVLLDEPEYLVQRSASPDCVCRGCNADPSKASMKPIDFVVVHRDSIADALTNIGPLGIALDASQSTFHFYKSGLYHDDHCSTETFNYFAVLVGYSPANQGSPDLPSFMVRNNFGPKWGESGHMRILKDEHRNKCLPQHAAIYPMLD